MLKSEIQHGVRVVRVAGKRIDAARAPEFRSEMNALIDEGPHQIVLDLEGVDFVDSSGLGAIVSGLKRLGPRGDLAIAAASGSVARLFALTRMDKVFPLHQDVDTAVKRLAE
ncbi:STAS domain-containing protein [Aurantimonas sp. HBX-1]|uniref:STAS domain-containing protein n=1 Tax=Aurantimonas sp. HBX-1 TaxID=2906072 RepID=UPI001F1CD432|nr:STAS domain-containing protein [Aurantimonas sp. HBX-1]UIJ70430.1 STAS domain-containing protein [Aurantimonas sp. HBX-1]